jgi:hypothetical protein
MVSVPQIVFANVLEHCHAHGFVEASAASDAVQWKAP